MDLSQLAEGINTVWVLLAAALVFFMEAGFAFLEAGFVRSKNSLNIVMKVFSDATFGTLAYWVIGFGVMFGLDRGGVLGTSGFLLQGPFKYL
ncbi:MAG TPA: ammonium transporter, partial [Spirochaetia bacterium]|nr:ammonium transporter [Spirochaetia bacterium]